MNNTIDFKNAMDKMNEQKASSQWNSPEVIDYEDYVPFIIQDIDYALSTEENVKIQRKYYTIELDYDVEYIDDDSKEVIERSTVLQVSFLYDVRNEDYSFVDDIESELDQLDLGVFEHPLELLFARRVIDRFEQVSDYFICYWQQGENE